MVNLSSRPAVLELLEAVREQGKAVVVISETKVDAPLQQCSSTWRAPIGRRQSISSP